uniref:WGS project CAEQ00000000 data, annotated contig 1140 n=1 Tax=Trypanosoma congolense (strain IL3000) TaxID=1068625 RepID=F9W430_TRYCI|nr:unnamed protein product [Trypanosoma congolense IL3000]
MNAAVYRTLVSASYLFWQDSMRIFIERYLPTCLHSSNSPSINAFMIGALAGSLNGSLLNGFQVVKYRMWSAENNLSFFVVTWNLYREKGVFIFFRGIAATTLRDCIFGVVYEMCRKSSWVQSTFQLLSHCVSEDAGCLRTPCGSHGSSKVDLAVHNTNTLPPSDTHRDLEGHSTVRNNGTGLSSNVVFVSNLFAAMLASVLSSPFNYVRSVAYGVPLGSGPVSYLRLLQSLYIQTLFVYRNGKIYGHANATAKNVGEPVTASRGQLWCYLEGRAARRGRHPMAAIRWMNSRLNIGWGSVRVGLGMAISQSVFASIQDRIRSR